MQQLFIIGFLIRYLPILFAQEPRFFCCMADQACGPAWIWEVVCVYGYVSSIFSTVLFGVLDTITTGVLDFKLFVHSSSKANYN